MRKLLIVLLLLSAPAFGKFAEPDCKNYEADLCQAIQKVADKLNGQEWSAGLQTQLERIWRLDEFTLAVTDREIEPPSGVRDVASRAFYNKEEGYYLEIERKYLKKSWFDAMLLHEYFHLADIKQSRETLVATNNIELERRAFAFNLRFTGESKDRTWLLGLKWKDKYASPVEFNKAIEKELRKHYKFDSEGMFDWSK